MRDTDMPWYCRARHAGIPILRCAWGDARMSDFSTQASSPISRRTFAKGAAWAAPVVAIAIAAPAAAASTTGSATVSLTKVPNKVVRINVAFGSGTVPNGTVFSVQFTTVPEKKTYTVGQQVGGVQGGVTYGTATNGTRTRVVTFTLTFTSDMTTAGTRYVEFDASNASGSSTPWLATVAAPGTATVTLERPTDGSYTF